MTRPTTLIALAFMAVLIVPAAARAAPPIERMGVYVLSDDLDRAAAFYERLFGKPAQVRTPVLVGFDVAGGFFAVASRGAFGKDAGRGATVAPYLRVGDIEGWFRHVQAVAPDRLVTPAVLREGPIALVKFTDPDGNVVELYAVTPR